MIADRPLCLEEDETLHPPDLTCDAAMERTICGDSIARIRCNLLVGIVLMASPEAFIGSMRWGLLGRYPLFARRIQ